MLPTERRPKSEAPLREARTESRRTTLPPPEWTSSRAGAGRPSTMSAEPLPRRFGTRAEEAWLRARAEEARASGDAGPLREACTTLARWLASRERDLDEAVELGTTALSLGAGLELRREVSAWLESLGEASRAAAVLKPLASTTDVDSVDAAYVLVQSGLLKARAGAAAGAAAAFDAAMSIDPSDALPAELLGALSAWQPDAVSAAAGAEAYVEAARRRAAQSQEDGEQDDLSRAFSADGSSDVAATALARSMENAGRPEAADEVRRAHARALSALESEAAAAVHAQRRMSALEAGDAVRALGAALDQSLDTMLDGEDGQAFDSLLLGVGMLDALAARLEVRAERAGNSTDRALHFAELGKLLQGPLSDSGRALYAYAAALAADSSCDAAIGGLRALLQDLPRVEALGDEGRTDPLGALMTSIEDRRDESERRGRILDTLGRNMVRVSALVGPDDEGASGSAAASRAWVRASLANEVRETAVSLERVAAFASLSLRGTLLCAAADRYLALGESAAARRVAEAAAYGHTTSVRAAVTLADSVTADHDRAAAAALERAIALAGPRLAWCRALADALEALGDGDLAVAWSQRCVTLRPGDIGAVERLLDRLLRSRDAGRLADALAWLLSQPQPLADVATPFGDALRELARRDPDRAAVVARRALDVFGPKSSPVREALLDAAECAGDEAFTAAVFERWLACGAGGADRRHLLTRLAELYERLGDEDGEARIVARAIREGLGSAAIDAHLNRLSGRPASPDAQLWRMGALANRLASGEGGEAAAWACRELGAGLWDLADDRVGAIAAWERAARMGGSGGHATLALDLVAFANKAFAFEYLGRRIDSEPDDRSAAAIAADVARAALAIGEPNIALDLAARGVARCPSWADALEVAELSAPRAGDFATLSGLYEVVGGRALGRFGRRAAHYRGARFFERRSETALALRHATQAFLALPGEGSSFQMLARAAEQSGDRGEAVRAVERVADAVVDRSQRAAWLLRAATLTGKGAEGAKQKVDVLLRAVASYPTVAAVLQLRHAMQGVLSIEPDETDALETRFARASREVIAGLRGPDGARVALAFAATAVDPFRDAESALASFERAFSCDGDLDEFAAVAAFAPVLARAEDAAKRGAAMLAMVDAATVNAGVAALRAIGEIAAAAGDTALAAKAAVLAVARDPEDDGLMVAADAAVRVAPEWGDLLSLRAPPSRRARALIATARIRAAAGLNAEAAGLFERALDWVTHDERRDVESELRAARLLSGRDVDPSDRPPGEETGSSQLRADRWTDVANGREQRRDVAGAVRALLEATRLDPDPLERWSALERVAELAGDEDAQVLALEQILMRVGFEGRVAVCRRLARAHVRRNDLDAAEHAWRDLLALDPNDEEADQAIEAMVVASGRFAELADHLGVRAQRLAADAARFEMLRAVRLRRAAILEQRLGRVQEACVELERLLVEAPDNSSGLRYLADLAERQGESARAAALWSRAAAVEPDVLERDDLHLRAGRASRAAGNLADALDSAARVLSRHPSNMAALQLRCDAARELGADVELGDALEAFAAIATDDVIKSDLLVEAALAVARTGQIDLALARAFRASVAAPHRATPQLLARGLEYRLRGAGTPDDARATIENLEQINEPMGADDVALRSFLLAEALDVVQGRAAGLRELDAIGAVAADHPLVALGMAERLAAQGQSAAAVEAYRRALTGPFLGLRPPSAVAMSAADSAIRAGLPEDALSFLAIAERYEDTRAAAQAWRTLLAQGPAGRSPPTPSERWAFEEVEGAVQSARTPGERAHAHLALGRRRLDRGDLRGAEILLREALAEGLVEAGDVLADLLRQAPDRSRDLLRVRRRQVALEPDTARLEALRVSALADGDRVYARAVEHVLRALEGGRLQPPPLEAQPDQPGIFVLLTRPSLDGVGEALALLWEGAAQLFTRDASGRTVPDASTFVMPGIERVVPAARPLIARVYDTVIRALDAPRIPLFVSRSDSGPPSSRIGMLWPPSVFLSGDVREETPELLFELGRGMSAALPQNVLCLGLPPPEGRAVVEALRVAFAPPEAGRQVEVRAARLAESFWHIVPARTQRRIQLLLSGAPFPAYEDLVERALQSGRRVGMFLSGDFGHAAGPLIAPYADGSGVPIGGNLRAICARSPMLEDLLRLAVSPEYASARWHDAEDGLGRRSLAPSQIPAR